MDRSVSRTAREAGWRAKWTMPGRGGEAITCVRERRRKNRRTDEDEKETGEVRQLEGQAGRRRRWIGTREAGVKRASRPPSLT